MNIKKKKKVKSKINKVWNSDFYQKLDLPQFYYKHSVIYKSLSF